MVNWTGIGVGAQSINFRGQDILLEKYVLKILKEKFLMPEFHMPLALKIVKISECLCYLPDKVTIFLNFTRFLTEYAQILRNNCPQKYLFTNFLGSVPPISYAYVDRQYK